MNHYRHLKQLSQSGFALMDVLLAVILIITIAAASYEMINTYHDKTNVQTVESDLLNIAQAYAPLQNQTALDYGGYNIFRDGGSWIATSFLQSVPIPASRIGTPNSYNGIDYSYLLTNLMNKNGQTVVGFEQESISDDSVAATLQYFIMGMQVNYSQAVQLIQDLNNTFSIFVGNSSTGIHDAKAATSLPQCEDKDCILNLYLVTPTLDNPAKLDGNFFAPSPLE